MRFTIRVRPGAGRTAVGGAHDGALVVRVGVPAVDSRATAAALAAVADALGVRRAAVRLEKDRPAPHRSQARGGTLQGGRLAELLSR